MENQKRIEQLKMEFQDILTDCYDFSIMDGWAEIVYDLLREVRDHYPDVKVLQIKEKFGGLRFYVDDYNDEKLNTIIHHTENKSNSICEFTGKQGELKSVNGWLKTACDEIYQRALRNNTWIGAYNEEGCISR